MLIYQSKANLDAKIFLIESLIFYTHEIEKVCKGFIMRGVGKRISRPFWSVIYSPLKFPTLKIVLNSDLNGKLIGELNETWNSRSHTKPLKAYS